MKPSEAPIKQPFVKRDFSPKKVLPILCPTCKKSVAACYDTIKNEVPTSTRENYTPQSFNQAAANYVARGYEIASITEGEFIAVCNCKKQKQ